MQNINLFSAPTRATIDLIYPPAKIGNPKVVQVAEGGSALFHSEQKSEWGLSGYN